MTLDTQLKVVFDQFNRVLMIPGFEKECDEVLKNKGELKRYYKSMEKKCEYLQANIDDHGGRYRSGYLEKMQGIEATGLSKIPISGNKKNYRIILYFEKIKGVEYAIFLHFFKEKKAKTDYKKAITKAKERYNSIKCNK